MSPRRSPLRSATLLALPLLLVGGALGAGCDVLTVLAFTKQFGCPCATGFVCLTDDNGQEYCGVAEALQEGDDCNDDVECGENLVCRDKYDETCPGTDIDLVCTTGEQEGKKCRRNCNPGNTPFGQCEPGEFCFSDIEGVAASGGFCQEGTCKADTECGLGNLCLFRNLNPDSDQEKGGGLCYRGCEPFNCSPGVSCDGCPPEDLDGDDLDDQMACIPLETSLAGELNRVVCAPAGPVAARGLCSINEACQPGSFCDIDPQNGNGICRPYCRRSGGAPACNAGELCTGVVDSTRDIGFCI